MINFYAIVLFVDCRREKFRGINQNSSAIRVEKESTKKYKYREFKYRTSKKKEYLEVMCKEKPSVVKNNYIEEDEVDIVDNDNLSLFSITTKMAQSRDFGNRSQDGGDENAADAVLADVTAHFTL